MKLKNKIQSWEIDGAAYQERLRLRVTGSYEAIMEIREFMESYGPAGIPDHIKQQANAWMAVASALDEVAPSWRDGDDCAMDLAVAAIKALAGESRQEAEEHTITIDGVTLIARGPQGCGKTRLLDRIREVMDTPKAKPLPFDLEAAKAGAPLVTRDGRKARFVAHVEQCEAYKRVIVHIEGDDRCTAVHESGEHLIDFQRELVMAPKPKRTVWVNVWHELPGTKAARAWVHLTEHESKRAAAMMGRNYVAIAVPVETDA